MGQFQTKCSLCEFFLAFTFVCPGYNLAMQTWTIQRLLNWITEYFTDKGIDSPRLSAELILSHIAGLKRIELYTQFDKPVAEGQLGRLHDLVKRAGQNEPVAYLTGRTEFYSLELNVTPDCMIPRCRTYEPLQCSAILIIAVGNRLDIFPSQIRQQAGDIYLSTLLWLTPAQRSYEGLSKLFQTFEHTVGRLLLDISFLKNLAFSYFKSSFHRFSFPWGRFPWKVNLINDLEFFNEIRQYK